MGSSSLSPNASPRGSPRGGSPLGSPHGSPRRQGRWLGSAGDGEVKRQSSTGNLAVDAILNTLETDVAAIEVGQATPRGGAADVVDAILSISSSGSTAARKEDAVRVLVNMCADEGKRRSVVDNGGVNELAGLLESADERLCVLAAQGVANLAAAAHTKDALGAAGAVERLVGVLHRTSNHVLQQKVMAALVNVCAEHDANRRRALDADMLSFAPALLATANNAQLVQHTLTAITNAMFDERTHIDIVERVPAIMAAVLRAAVAGDGAVRATAVWTLAVVSCALERVQEAWADAGALKVIPRLVGVSQPDDDVRKRLLTAIVNFSTNDRLLPQLVELGTADALASLRSWPIEHQTLAMQALQNLALDAAAARRIASAGCVPPIVATLQCANVTLQEYALRAITNLAADSSVRIVLNSAHTLEAIEPFLSSSTEQLAKNAKNAKTNLTL
jgi:Armadillo/beta-catenin-like repeat